VIHQFPVFETAILVESVCTLNSWSKIWKEEKQ